MSSDAALRRPRLHARFAVQSDGESAFLLSERDVVRLHGAVYTRLLPLLDGSRRLADLPSLLTGACPPAEVYYAVERLRRGGYLTLLDDGDSRLPDDPTSIFWKELTGGSRASAPAAHVGVIADGCLAPAAREAVAECGLVVADDAAVADAVLIVADDYRSPALQQVAQACRQRTQPCLVVKPAGTQVCIGPLLVPGATACLECLVARLGGHRRLHAILEEQAGNRIVIPAGRLDVTVGLAVRLAAFELARWLARADGRDQTATLEGQILTLDLRTMETARHHVEPMTGCPHCVGSRRETTRETRPDRLVSPLSGVVRELRCVSGDDDIVRVWSAGPNVAYPVNDTDAFIASERAAALGRGLTDASARAGAIGEAVERYSATFRGDEPCTIASLMDLGGLGIDPQSLLNVSDRQYERRIESNAVEADRRRLIPTRLDPSRPIAWTQVRRLMDGSIRYLPTACCYLGYSQVRRDWDAIADSNGTAAGRTRDAAIRHGFLEVVERDAVAIWWYNRLRRPGIDIETLGDPWMAVLLAEHRRRGLRTWLLDITTDLGVPVVAAISAVERSGDPPVIVTGFAAADALGAAARAALLEASQMAALVDPSAAAEGWARLSVIDHPYLLPDETRPLRRGDDYSSGVGDDRAAIESHVGAAARAGLDAFVLDLSRSDVGVPVVKVFVPGARHFWPRLGPGRLYDVPVRMGERVAAPSEADLNDAQIPF
jgi:bacteriocin biosynthesis cyclodehydratase domain-containing protein